MGRILFVTVGTSAITNRELWEENGDLPVGLPQEGDWGEMIRAAEAKCVRDLTHHGRVNWEEVESQVRNDHAAFERELTDLHRRFRGMTDHQRRAHPRRTSAEVISTWLAGKGKEPRMDGGPLEAGEDKVVLVVSRTCIGQMAGRINDALFRECLFTGDGEPEVFTETVDDLRLEGIREEGGEAKSLSDRMREIYEEHADSRAPLFNITGGFKGLIPAITVICSEAGRPMLYMHDSMNGTVRLRFENGRVREEYEEFHV